MKEIKDKLIFFTNLTNNTVLKITATDDTNEYLHTLAHGVKNLAHAAIQLGDIAWEELQELPNDIEDKAALLPYYVLHFSWADQVKSYLLLWQQVLFQHQKAQILQWDNKVNGDAISQLKKQSAAIMDQAVQELKNGFDDEIQRIQTLPNGVDKYVAACLLQENPWQVYKAQLKEIPKQCELLLEQGHKLEKIAHSFVQIKQLFQNTVQTSRTAIEKEQNLAETTIEFIETYIADQPGKIAKHLEELETKENPVDYTAIFTPKLEALLTKISTKTQIIVATDGSLLQYKDIAFQKNTRQWIEAEILPILYEVWELTTNVTNSLKMSLINIRNRASLLSNDVKEGRVPNTKDVCQPLQAFLQRANLWTDELDKLSDSIQERVEQTFHITNIYHSEEDFLPIRFQATLNQYKFNQNEWVSKVQIWFKQQLENIQQLKASVRQEEALSISEKIVRFVQSRISDPANSQYANIFLTKGFVANSFIFGRQQELQHIEALIKQWQKGYRGAVILSGKRLCGKSVFGDLVAHRYFSDNTVRLSPNTPFSIEGRKFTPNHDLEQALDFVKKYTITSKYMVWIDDLELWSSPNFSLSQNIQALCKHIDRHSSKIFFMVAMHKQVQKHFDKIHRISKTFQTTIELEQMSESEIRQAILTRHGATHKMLVTENETEVRPKQFQKMIAQIYKATQGNIGEAIHHWTFSTRKIDAERVTHLYQDVYGLPDFINANNALLLTTLILHKRINEYHLRKLFGSPFKEKYSDILQRLISVGLLTRLLDGSLEINEPIANEVEALLILKKYL